MPDGVRLVITGGIGSGKSSVSGFLTNRGWQVLDADVVGHEVLTRPEVMAEVARMWPATLKGGRLDRGALGRLVFADPAELDKLESLVHPRIARHLEQWMGVSSENRAVEISVAKVISSTWRPVLVVDAPDSIRQQRAMDKGLNASQVTARMQVQPTRQEWLRLADYVISNRGSLADLEAATSRLASALKRP